MNTTAKIKWAIANLGFVWIVLIALIATIPSFLTFALLESIGIGFEVAFTASGLLWPVFTVVALNNTHDLKENPK